MTGNTPPLEMKQVPSPNTGGRIDPRLIVMHYTATWTGAAAIRTLTNPQAKVSAHFVVDRNGTITQLVRTDTAAWHAGPSKWGRYEGLNNHSIGIELVNIGYVRALANGNYIDPYGKVLKGADVEKMGLIGFQDDRLEPGAYYQPLYPEAQLTALDKLVRELLRLHPKIEAIVTHRQIDSRGWKVDPGPAFPMARYTRLLPDRASKEKVTRVSVASLNVREKPNARAKTVSWSPIRQGTEVRPIRQENGWTLVQVAMSGQAVQAGWVKSEFISTE